MKLSAKLQKTLRFYLLFLFIGYYGSVSFFYHTHVVNGTTVVHSHPFKSSNHNHSEDAYVAIQFFNTLTLTFTALLAAFLFFNPFINFLNIKWETIRLKSYRRFIYLLRAPPVAHGAASKFL